MRVKPLYNCDGRICRKNERYLPQALLNYRRKSVKGFNTTGIIIKLLGACFLSVNAFLTGESYPVIAYGLLNIIQHSFFMVQFYLYSDQPNAHYFLLWTLFPVIPLAMGLLWPDSMTITNGIKPLAQILSHLPQLMECARQRTTQGVSLASQHLNAAGGLAGLYMLTVEPPVAATTYLLYINSVFQAFSIYLLACYYGEFSLSLSTSHAHSSSALPTTSPPSAASPSTAVPAVSGVQNAFYSASPRSLHGVSGGGSAGHTSSAIGTAGVVGSGRVSVKRSDAAAAAAALAVSDSAGGSGRDV